MLAFLKITTHPKKAKNYAADSKIHQLLRRIAVLMEAKDENCNGN